jgi:acyl-CoA reductase-like NAD-dependent aldehyde dehydrogenase
MSLMNTFGVLINGAVPDVGASFEVINPATLEIVGRAPDCGPDQLDAAMRAAQKAFGAWRLDEDRRRDALRLGAARMAESAERIATVLTQEQGKPLKHAMEEVLAIGWWFTYFAELERNGQILQDDPGAFIEVTRRPIGVVAAITPWNFPLGLAAWKLAPALRAGNTIVLKPSPFTPLSTLLMAETLCDVLPSGVLNVVTGGEVLGAAMISHPLAGKISFTGSIATGRKVATAAAGDLKHVTLELGGNDAAIVLEQTAPKSVAPAIFDAAFGNCGQVCTAIKRVYAHRSIVEELTAELAALARTVVVGDGMAPETEMGPINNAPQYRRVTALIEDAVGAGATAVAGGQPLTRPGYFVAPTILRHVAEGVAVVDEEQFGPVLPIMAYDDVDEAVLRANGSQFGLSGSVWADDPDRAAAVARRLECGTAWVNTHMAVAPHIPFGGIKSSGIGVENGPWGLDEFTDVHVLNVARKSVAADDSWEAR